MNATSPVTTQEQRQAAARSHGIQVGQIVRIRSTFYGLCCDVKVTDVYMNFMEVQFENGNKAHAAYSKIYRKEA